MKHRYTLLPLISLLLYVDAQGQVQYSIGNFMRYGNGDQFSANQTERKEYFENQTNVRLFWSDVTIGFQYLYDDPPEFGPRYQGLKKRYIEFNRDWIELRAGDYYTLYGKGLVMNLFENRGINYDTGLDGFRGIFRHQNVNAIAAIGTMKYYDLIETTRIETYALKSGHVELKPVKGVTFSGSIVHAEGDLPSRIEGFDKVESDIPEYSVAFSHSGVDFYASYAQKRSRITRPRGGGVVETFEHTGDARYASLSYTSDIGLGITLEYKDYRFDRVGDFSKRSEATRPTRMLPFQNPPIVFKEHLFYLLSRNNHVIDFNDEIGFQFDSYYAVTPEITINLNASMASRHDSYELDPLGNVINVIPRPNAVLPSSDKRFSPFYELYGEFEWFFEGHSYVRTALTRRYDNIYTDYTRSSKAIYSTTLPIRIEYGIGHDYSLGLSFEQQWMHDDELRKNKDYYNQYVAVTFTRSALWAATVRFEKTTSDETDLSEKTFWMAGEITYRLGAHSITFSGGTERGGLICSNGICRVLQSFDGLRFSILSQL